MTAELLANWSTSSARSVVTIALGAAILSLLLLAALHFLRTDLEPSWRVISEYANGPHGWLMAIAFAALAISCAATVLSLAPFANSWVMWVGLGLVVLASIGLAMAALFPADVVQDPMPPMSWTGNMHAVASMLGNPTLMIGMLILAYTLPGFAPWQASGALLQIVAHLAWISFVAMIVGLFVFLPQGTGGLGALVGYGNRVLVAAYAVWLIAANWPLRG